MSGLLLYDHPYSSYAQMIRIGLREKGLDFTARIPSDMAQASPSGAFATANPRAEVPVLVDGDTTVFESSIILEYLDDKWPTEHQLLPKDPAKRAEARLTGEVVRTQYEAINWAVGEVRMPGRAGGELKSTIERNAQRVIEVLQEWLTKRLGSSSYFNGEHFGYADLCVAPIVNRSLVNGFGPKEGSPLHDWLLRVKQRPSIQETFAEFEAGAKALAKMGNPFMDDASPMKRQFRDHRLDAIIRCGGLDIVRQGLEKKNIRLSWPDIQK